MEPIQKKQTLNINLDWMLSDRWTTAFSGLGVGRERVGGTISTPLKGWEKISMFLYINI